MEIGISEADGATVVELSGELDGGAADELRQALSALLDQGRARLVVDLEGVPYVESRGLSALVTAMKRARALGGDLKLCALRADEGKDSASPSTSGSAETTGGTSPAQPIESEAGATPSTATEIPAAP